MRRALTLALGLLAWPALAAEEYPDSHPTPGVTVERTAGARRYLAVVPGPLLDWAAGREEGGRRLYLLAAPEGAADDRRALYRLELVPPGWSVLSASLPSAFDRLATVDIDGDGIDELLLGRAGELTLAAPLDGSAPLALTSLFRGRGVDLAAAAPVRGAPADRDTLHLPTVGTLRVFAPRAAGWGLAARRPLPTTARRRGHGVRLTSPELTLLRLAEGDVVAAGPEPVGRHRLRSLLLTADESEDREAWSRLPAAEQVQWSWFDVLDGRPILIVTTNSAERLGVLERQDLRLFSLYRDRTRSGVGPWLEATTTSRRWQRLEPFVSDLDDDGDRDLIVAQTDGLGGGKTVLEAFVNDGRRGFEPARRRSLIDRAPDGWHFGDDLTGDDLPDLVLVSAGELAVYETRARGGRLVDRRPRWSYPGTDIPRVDRSVEIGPGGVAFDEERSSRDGRPAVVDLDGDGRGELVLAENPRWGFGRLRVVFLPE